jgi:endonuclease I
MKKTIFLSLLFVTFLFFNTSGQIPPGYYDPANGLSGTQLQAALHNIIKNHTVKSYDYLWTAFETTDDKPNGTVWDMYSDIPGGTAPYVFHFGSDQCGSYNGEGDCYNREHSFPQSWFGSQSPMVSDLFHIYPTDGYVNGHRSNYPFAKVGSASWTSENGSKVGTCSTSGYTGTVFEPRDEYKGDFARSYFYMSVRYYQEDSGWPGSDQTNGAQLKPWALQLMLHWSGIDPVSTKEIDRNNTIYGIQHNRNPFIDHPEFAYAIWGNPVGIGQEYPESIKLEISPNPVKDLCKIDLPADLSENAYDYSLISLSGQVFHPELSHSGNTILLNVQSLSTGMYFLVVKSNTAIYHAKLIKE